MGSAALLAFTVPQVYAADDETATDDDNELEEIVVTGIRGSQMRALQTKRNADSIVDGIAAEDMGKFADANISEALQRIPGVTIARNGGEGQFITVRGMGPAFNTVLYNGRVLATENDGREFSFDVIPAELISSVEVFKSATTDLVEGGIGATVNMKTARPLDREGFHGAMSVKGLYDSNRKNTQPQFSGVLSDTFMDGKFGVLGSFSYNKREFQNERVFTDGFEANRDIDFDNDGTPELTGVSIPTFTSFDFDRSTRKRISGSLTLQWQANEDLLLTLDGLYSKLDVAADSRSIFFYPDFGRISNATVDSNNTVTSYEGYIDQRIVTFVRPRFAKTRAIGFNAEWQANDNLSAVFDAAYSKATDTTAGNQAWFDTNLNSFDPAVTTYQQSPSGVPSYTNIGNPSDPSQATFGWFTWEGRSIKDETYQSTMDLTYDFDDAGVLTSINTGVSFAQREKIKTVAKTPGNIQNLFNGVALPQNLFSTIDTSGFLGGSATIPDFSSYSVTEVETYLLSDAGINAKAIMNAGPGADATAIAAAETDIRSAIAENGGTLGVQPVLGSGGDVKEKNYSAYIQANFAGSFGETPWSVNMGLRYTRTDIRSGGFGQELIRIDTPPNGDPVPVFSPAMSISETGSYNVWLPNINFKLDAYEDIVFRASIAKTLTRATLSDLILARNFNVRVRERNVSSGNPGLKPLIAWNYDANLTWYIDEASYLSVAWFHKNLTGGSTRVTQTVQLLGLDFFSTRPENKGTSVVDGVELTGQYTFSSLPAPFDGLGLQGNYTNVTTGDNTDGQSESYNVVGFYEKGPIQARIAYVYRAGYLASAAANRGQPKNIRAYGQWDASVSYDLPVYGLTVFAEAINITNAQSLSFSIYQNRVIQLQDTGARYTFGVRAAF